MKTRTMKLAVDMAPGLKAVRTEIPEMVTPTPSSFSNGGPATFVVADSRVVLDSKQ